MLVPVILQSGGVLSAVTVTLDSLKHPASCVEALTVYTPGKVMLGVVPDNNGPNSTPPGDGPYQVIIASTGMMSVAVNEAVGFVQVNILLALAVTFTSVKFPNWNGPEKSLSSAVNDDDDLVFTIKVPNRLEQGAWLAFRLSKPSAVRLMPNSANCNFKISS